MTDRSPADSSLADPFAEDHSRRLADLIRAQAAAHGGFLPFDCFMELALYAPGLGYYAAGSHKFGAGGDFVTAPEISPLFGRCLARQCAEILAALGGGDVMELGAGTGTLAADLLDGLLREGILPGRYLILEPSPDLRVRQQALLRERRPELSDRVHWLDRLPQDFTGVMLANEVADAMPVHRFAVREDGSVAEIFVRSVVDGWDEVAGDPDSPGLADAVYALQAQGLAREPGYKSEINLRLHPWIAALAGAMDRGLVLLIDYGYPRSEYYHHARNAGTLMCHYRHQAHGNPFVHLGLQDITAHVDFSALADAGLVAGMEVAGFTTQAHFLIGCGLDELLAEVLAGGGDGLGQMLGAKQLVMPTGMGERFRVLGLAKDVSRSWCGFSLRDLRGRLDSRA